MSNTSFIRYPSWKVCKYLRNPKKQQMYMKERFDFFETVLKDRSTLKYNMKRLMN